jgi:hypothetical protein
MAAAISPLSQQVQYLREFYKNAKMFLDAMDELHDAASSSDVAALHDEHLQRVTNTANCCYASARTLDLPTDPSPLLHALSGEDGKELHANWTRAIDTIYQLHGDTHTVISRLYSQKVEATKSIVAIIEQRIAKWSKISTGPVAGEPPKDRATHSAETDPGVVDYVDLDQAAALVNRGKKTLERKIKSGKMLAPDVEGGGGKKHEWDYAKLKPWLEKEYGKLLPPRPPHTVR